MNALVRPFLAICLFRIGPQDLPTSTVLLGVALVAHAVSGALVSMLVLGFWQAIAAGITGTALLSLLAWSLLLLNRLPERTVQTLSALAGCDALVSFIAFPVMLYAHSEPAARQVAGPLALALVVWSIAVFGHVLRHALATTMMIGVVVAVVFYWISMSVLNHLFV